MNTTMRDYSVYILASHSQRLYIGMTSSLERRVYEHKHKLIAGFTARYNIDKLVYVENYLDVHEAMARENQPKRWRRDKKFALVERHNPGWKDLSADWFR